MRRFLTRYREWLEDGAAMACLAIITIGLFVLGPLFLGG